MLRGHTLYFVLTLACSLAGQAMLKVGVRHTLGDAKPTGVEFVRDYLPALALNWRIIVGVALCGVGFVAWLYVLSIYDLGRALPILGGLAFIAMFLVGWLVLREPLSWWNAAGVVCLIAGVYLLSLKPA